MLLEDEVVDAVACLLTRRGWTITQMAHAHQHGNDLDAERDGLLLSAKGAGSSKPGTNRYGSSFTGGQVRSHIAVALLRAMAWVSTGDRRAAIALPDNRRTSTASRTRGPSDGTSSDRHLLGQ